jgi:hypothetical protein
MNSQFTFHKSKRASSTGARFFFTQLHPLPLGCVLISAEPRTNCYAVRAPAEMLLFHSPCHENVFETLRNIFKNRNKTHNSLITCNLHNNTTTICYTTYFSLLYIIYFFSNFANLNIVKSQLKFN